MRIILKHKEDPPRPKKDDERVRITFAYFPIIINNKNFTTIRWLEKVSIKQRYCIVYGWENIEFID